MERRSTSSTSEDALPPPSDAEPLLSSFPEIASQLSEYEAQHEQDPNDHRILIGWAELLVSFSQKLLSTTDPRTRSKKLSSFVKENLFVACTKYQMAHSIDRRDWKVLMLWGDVVLIIAENFGLPLFELAMEKYEMALTLSTKPHKILHRHGTALSLHACFLHANSGFISDLTPRALDNLAEEKFTKAIRHKPDSFQVLTSWATALAKRIQRIHVAADILEELSELGSKLHQALIIKPSAVICLQPWAKTIDYVVTIYLLSDTIPFKDMQPQLESFFDVYRQVAEKEDVSLQSIVSFALVENEHVHKLAFGLLTDLASKCTLASVKDEAARALETLTSVLETRKKQHATNLKKCLGVLKHLPPKAYREYERSKLSPEIICDNLDLFMNCLYFVVDKDVGKDPVFEPFRRQAKAPKRAKSSKKRWTQDDFCAFFDDGSDPLLLLVGILTNSTCTAARLVKDVMYVNLNVSGFGEVDIAEVSDGTKVAIKIIHGEQDSDNIMRVLSEIDAMKRCKHKNVVNFMDAYYHDNQIWLVMEYCDGGTLHDLYSEVFLAEEEISYFIRQICEGLTYLHGIGLAHLDIKSENILLNLNGQVKIADFGLVRQADLDTPNLSGMVGTCYWMAPEIIQRKMYNQKADIWALGCVCIELAQGKAPNHDGGALRALFHSATRGAPQIEAITEGKPANWSEEMMDFLQLSLQMDPQARPSAAQLLEHPFLNKLSPPSKLRKKLEVVFIGTSLRMNGLL